IRDPQGSAYILALQITPGSGVSDDHASACGKSVGDGMAEILTERGEQEEVILGKFLLHLMMRNWAEITNLYVRRKPGNQGLADAPVTGIVHRAADIKVYFATN